MLAGGVLTCYLGLHIVGLRVEGIGLEGLEGKTSSVGTCKPEARSPKPENLMLVYRKPYAPEPRNPQNPKPYLNLPEPTFFVGSL